MLADRIRMCIGKLRRLIDRTTPTIVVNQPFSTEGNGGRKLVRLKNGWLLAFVRVGNKAGYASIQCRISKDQGSNWELGTKLNYRYSPSTIKDLAVTSVNNTVYLITASKHSNADGFDSGNEIMLSTLTLDDLTSGSKTLNGAIVENYILAGKVSICSNSIGTEIHASWISRNMKINRDAYNIRYCKGEIQSNGNIAWDSVEQVTGTDKKDYYFEYVNIIVDSNNYPLISTIYREYIGYSVRVIGKNRALPSSGGFVNGPWNIAIVFSYTTKAQSAPSTCIDKDGVMHLVWQDDTIAGQPRIRYSKSMNSGQTWSTSIIIESASTSYQKPSISVNSSNELFIGLTHGGWVCMYKSTDYGNTWKIVDEFVKVQYGDDVSLLTDNTINFDIPPNISMTGQYTPNYPSSVIFSGKWHE